MQIEAAGRRQCEAHNRLTGLGTWPLDLLLKDIMHTLNNGACMLTMFTRSVSALAPYTGWR